MEQILAERIGTQNHIIGAAARECQTAYAGGQQAAGSK